MVQFVWGGFVVWWGVEGRFGFSHYSLEMVTEQEISTGDGELVCSKWSVDGNGFG